MELPDFHIYPTGPISKACLDRKILTFQMAAAFIARLRYGRNHSKCTLTTLFADDCGTCSTKHAFLKQLADENNFDIQLMLGIFKMNADNTPKIAPVLAKYNLHYIPEAHNYLRYNGSVFDFTTVDSNAADFQNELITEIEILPDQIADFKVSYHKKFLSEWLDKKSLVQYSIYELWQFREECIAALSQKN